jgi:hypothetical protein
MSDWKLYGLIIVVACFMIFAPVSACYPILHKTGPQAVCPTCDYYEYTITASASEPVAALRVQDTLPNALTFVSSTPAPTQQVGQTLTWIFTPGTTSTQTITVRVKPSASVPSVSNFVSGNVKQYVTSGWTEYRDTSQTPVVTTFDRKLCTSVPEFPSTVIPMTMIIGLLGAVLFIRRTKE